MSNPAVAAKKCVVWDLDGTLWHGVLEEGDVQPRPEAIALVKLLDERGILQSIVSRNEAVPALAKLREFGIEEYFLAPQFTWGAKSEAVRRVAAELNLHLNALAFIDDQPLERDEVSAAYSEVLCLDGAELEWRDRPEFRPSFHTSESRARRQTYLVEARRQKDEETFPGLPEEFAKSLELRMTVSRASEADLDRMQELTKRTHQLNSTGRTYSAAELLQLCTAEDHLVLVASLDDRYGSYGRIGVAVLEKESRRWTLRLLLVSCRVISRGAGTLFLGTIVRGARAEGVTLRTEFVPTPFNRVTYIMLKLAGFIVVDRDDDRQVLELPACVPWHDREYADVSTTGWCGEDH